MKKTVSGPFLSRGNNSETTPLLSGEREMNHVADGGSVIVENDVSHVCSATFVILPHFGLGVSIKGSVICSNILYAKRLPLFATKNVATFCTAKALHPFFSKIY